MKKESGIKYDAGKPSIALIPKEILYGIASVLDFGAKKYTAHNWRGGMKWSRLISAAFRHLIAFNNGEDTDPESGLPHLDHLGCCIAFLRTYYENNKDLDDRYKKEEK